MVAAYPTLRVVTRTRALDQPRDRGTDRLKPRFASQSSLLGLEWIQASDTGGDVECFIQTSDQRGICVRKLDGSVCEPLTPGSRTSRSRRFSARRNSPNTSMSVIGWSSSSTSS